MTSSLDIIPYLHHLLILDVYLNINSLNQAIHNFWEISTRISSWCPPTGQVTVNIQVRPCSFNIQKKALTNLYISNIKAIFHNKVYRLLTLRCLELQNFFSFQYSSTVNWFFQKCKPFISAAFACRYSFKISKSSKNIHLKLLISLLYRVTGSILQKKGRQDSLFKLEGF